LNFAAFTNPIEMDKTLLILAAGIGSRYGGVKQLAQIGPSGEVLIDYSIHDAIEAGFNKIVFIVSARILDDVKEVFDQKLKGKVKVEYVIQDKGGREKPWGTGHAILCAKDVINEPFAAINADDFYGKDAYKTISKFMDEVDMDAKNTFSLVGFHLGKTLSEQGTVSRGVCSVDKSNHLVSIEEITKLKRENSKIQDQESGRSFDDKTIVSMNFWGFGPSIFPHLERLFTEFQKNNVDNPKAEFYIPSAVDHMIHHNNSQVRVLESNAHWLGLTYAEDRPFAENLLQELVDRGDYPTPIW